MRRIATAVITIAVAALLAAPAVASADTLPFSSWAAKAHVKRLCAYGPRVEGSRAEHLAFDYIARRLTAEGYTVTVQDVALPGRRKTHNVIAEKPGRSSRVVVLGAHVDSKKPAPGANDNGSGVGTLLELSRNLAGGEVEPTVRFVFFGGEEMSDRNENHHHYGSRAYVRTLTLEERARICAMVSVDMVGHGGVFNVRSMRVAPTTAVTSLQRAGAQYGQPLPFLKDRGRYGWSDHEAFERAGIPSAWLEWRADAACHTRRDRYSRISRYRLASTGRLLTAWLAGITPEELASLRP